jgi:hypothetical protein
VSAIVTPGSPRPREFAVFARGLELARCEHGGNMQVSNVIAGLALATLTSASAHAQPAPPQLPPRVVSAPTSARDGTIQQVLLTPRGDIDGLLLGDGTAVRFPPHAVIDVTQLRAGSAVHVEGSRVADPDGATLFDARVTIGASVVADAGRPPPPPGDPRATEPALTSLTVHGRVTRVLANPDGVADAVVLDDGTMIHVGPGDALARAGVAKGVELTATGLGGAYPTGRSIAADTVKVGNRAAVTIDRTPPPRPVAP